MSARRLMPAPVSAGILLFRQREQIEVLLIKPGGPFWRNKDARAWSIPKGEFAEGDEPETTARREFAEELGVAGITTLSPGIWAKMD